MRKNSVLAVYMLLSFLLSTIAVIGFVVNEEMIWGMGIALLLFDTMILPVLLLRERRISRMDTSEPVLTFVYSYHEADFIAANLLQRNKKRRMTIAIFISICLLFMGLVFMHVGYQSTPDTPIWRRLYLIAPALLPFLVLILHGAYEKGLVLRDPCRSLIGKQFLLLYNTRPTVNERGDIALHSARIFEKEGKAYLQVTYKSSAKGRYGGTYRFEDGFDILIPDGQEDAARAAIIVK